MAPAFSYFACLFVLGLNSAVLGPTLPQLAVHTGASIEAISLLFSASAFGFLIGSFAGGKLYEKFNGHAILALALLTEVGVVFTAPLLSSYWSLVGLITVTGIAQSVMIVGGNTLLVWRFQDSGSVLMNSMHFCFGLGALLSPVFVGLSMTHSSDVNWAFWAIGIITIPAIFLVISQPAPKQPEKNEDGEESTGHTDYRLVFIISVFYCFYVGGEIGFGGWVYTFAVKNSLMTVADAAYLVSAFWGSVTVGRLLSVAMVLRFSPTQLITMNVVGGIVSLGIFWATAHTGWGAWMGTILTGLFLSSTFPNMLNWMREQTAVTSKAMGWCHAGASVGAITIPWVIGYYIESIGTQFMLWVVLAAFLSLGAVFIALLFYAKKQRERESLSLSEPSLSY